MNYLSIYILMENLYIALCTAILFFILKMILDKDKEDDVKRNNLKDAIYIFCIIMLVLFGKDYYFLKESGKAKVFTNEPGF
jgi:hypothetical protein